VSIERCDDLYSFLSPVVLLDLVLFGVIEDALNLDLLDLIVVLEGIKILCLGPEEVASVAGSDVDGCLTQE
jgi:2-keto-3-deoxy-L-rhamnonate aldolase RhmA